MAVGRLLSARCIFARRDVVSGNEMADIYGSGQQVYHRSRSEQGDVGQSRYVIPEVGRSNLTDRQTDRQT